MKQTSQVVLLVFLTIFLLFSFSITSARLLPPYQEEQLVKTNIHEEDDLFNLMGLVEECDGKDEEYCIKRRMIAEAHLDYIYTQHHKPKASP